MKNPFESIRDYYLNEKKIGHEIGHWGEYYLAQAIRMLGEEVIKEEEEEKPQQINILDSEIKNPTFW